MISFEKMHQKILQREEEFFSKLLPEREIKQIGKNYRIQPCPKCGHSDCMTLNGYQPTGHCFSCGFKGNLWQITKEIIGNTSKTKKFIENFIGDKISLSGNNKGEKEQIIAEIRRLYADKCKANLLSDEKYLNYQLNRRKHFKSTIEKYCIGKAISYTKVKTELISMGFTKEDINEAKIYVPEGLMIYPYFDRFGDIVRFNTKNPFKIKDRNGEVIKGYSTGSKTFYRSIDVNTEEVMIVEGENDLLSIVEAGYNSVFATGGQLTDKQIDQLRGYKKLYLCFDNDDTGAKYTKKLNDALPEVKVYKIVFNSRYKDIDEFLKNSNEYINMNSLLDNAVELENSKYTITINGNELLLQNRNFKIAVKVRDCKDGRYKIDFKYYEQERLEYIKNNIFLHAINKKYIEYIEPIYEVLEKHYNSELEQKSIFELLSIRRISRSYDDIMRLVAKKFIETGHDEGDIDEYLSRYDSQLKKRILQEINLIKNTMVDPNTHFENICIAQAFDLERNRGYMYFNLRKLEDNNILKSIPALLTNDKRIIRLDLLKRKDKQQILLIDNALKIPYEIETAVMDDETVSLTNKYAQSFVDGKINSEDFAIRKLVKLLEINYKKVYYTEDQRIYKVLALYTMATYYYQLFGEMGYLFLNGEKGNGKSLLCKLLETYCFSPKYTVATSEAALFRSISFEGGTFILDELENLGSRGRANESTMGQILKAGYSKDGGKTMRVNMETGGIEKFSLYGPKIIANIFGLEDVIGDRCIPINVRKYSSKLTQTKENIKVFLNENKESNKELTSMCCISALLNFKEVYNVYSAYKFEGFSARSTQILRPLFVIAHLAGEEYEKAMAEYYEQYIVSDKKWIEGTTPEGMIREILTQIAEEICNRNYRYLKEENNIKDTYYRRKDDDHFEVNTFVVKLLLDLLDGNRGYSMKETHKLLKRIFPECKGWKRTTISFKDNPELVIRNNNKSSVSVYVLTFPFRQFLKSNCNIIDLITGGDEMKKLSHIEDHIEDKGLLF